MAEPSTIENLRALRSSCLIAKGKEKEGAMNTYITLIRLTQAGAENNKNSPKRMEDANPSQHLQSKGDTYFRQSLR